MGCYVTTPSFLLFVFPLDANTNMLVDGAQNGTLEQSHLEETETEWTDGTQSLYVPRSSRGQ